MDCKLGSFPELSKQIELGLAATDATSSLFNVPLTRNVRTGAKTGIES